MLLNLLTPNEIAKEIAARVRARRLEMNLTQRALSVRAGLPFSTYRRFEQRGEIALKGLLQIAFALNMLSDFNTLFTQCKYESIEDALREVTYTRKRGKRNE